MSPLRSFMLTASSQQVVIGAVKVSAVVGTLLNLFNQGAACWAGEGADWPRLILNFAVPYCVATYSAARLGALDHPRV